MRTQVASEPRRAAVLSQAVANVAERLALKTVDLQRILGISQASASRLMGGAFLLRENSKEWEAAALLVRLYRGLHAIVGNNDEHARIWLRSPNQAFGQRTPHEEIQSLIGLVHACDYIDAHRATS